MNGIEDGSKAVLGIENPLDEEEWLCNLIADSIEPRLAPNVEFGQLERSLVAFGGGLSKRIASPLAEIAGDHKRSVGAGGLYQSAV